MWNILTENGKEFNNPTLKIYLDNNNIKYLRSAPNLPQTNGICEAVHKEIKNYLLYLKENKPRFNWLGYCNIRGYKFS